MTISGQKQVNPCPIGECAATVEKMVLRRSSGKRRQSLWKYFWRKLLFMFSRDDNRRVPSKKCSSSMAPKHDPLGNMYASHFSMTGKSSLCYIFWSRHYTNLESSTNTRYPYWARPERSSVKLCETKPTDAMTRE